MKQWQALNRRVSGEHQAPKVAFLAETSIIFEAFWHASFECGESPFHKYRDFRLIRCEPQVNHIALAQPLDSGSNCFMAAIQCRQPRSTRRQKCRFSQKVRFPGLFGRNCEKSRQ